MLKAQFKGKTMSLIEQAPAADLTRTGRSPASGLSPEERRAREAAVRFANASVGLEGFQMSPDAERKARLFMDGEIDLAEFLQRQ
jgi:hypothetical protein